MLNLDLTQAILIGLRKQGFDVPSLSNVSDATSHFGGGLSIGDRYYCTTTNLIRVYNGSEWIVQKTC